MTYTNRYRLTTPDAIYTPEFFRRSAPSSKQSAEEILKIIPEMYPGFPTPASIIDVGCGSGEWLEVAHKIWPTAYLVGTDGPWVKDVKPKDRHYDFDVLDLTNADAVLWYTHQRPLRYDLVICTEVGEHIHPRAASNLVKLLTLLGDHVLFSAAIPGQTGTGHVNCQWQSYWADFFSLAADFYPYDVIRPHVWHNKKVAWWYSQNMLMYGSGFSIFSEYTHPTELLDVIHPLAELSVFNAR
jgi:SAM-dependent methyltransferase